MHIEPEFTAADVSSFVIRDSFKRDVAVAIPAGTWLGS